jgi:MFS family permease
MDNLALREWRDGWKLVLSACVGMSLSSLIVYAMGVFIRPLELEFGWSRSEITSGFLINSCISVVCAPIIGLLIDRFGPRRVALVGVILFCSALASFATGTASIYHWWTLWVVVSFAMLGVAPTIWVSAVVSRFDQSRGLALAVTLSGTGLTGIIAPLIAGYAVEAQGWRTAFVVLAIMWAFVTVPVVAAFFHGKTDIRRTEISLEGADKSKDLAAQSLMGMTRHEALRSSKFYRLAASVFLIVLVLSGAMLHIVPIFIETGMSPSEAASVASLIGIATIIGRLGAGFMLDRFDARLVGAAFFLLPALLMVFFLVLDDTVVRAVGVAVLLGLCTGAEFDVAAYLTARYFGMRSYGFLFGVIAGLLSLAVGVGPALYSATYDRFATYDPVFYAAIPIVVIATILIATLGQPDASGRVAINRPSP